MSIGMQINLKWILAAAIALPLFAWADPIARDSNAFETVSEVMAALSQEARRRRAEADRQGRTGPVFTQSEIQANRQRLSSAQPDRGAVADDGLLGVAESLERLFCSRSCDPRCRVIEVKQIGEENRKFLANGSEGTFASVGRVICTSGSGRPLTATATVVGDRNTLVTVSHYRSSRSGAVGEFGTCRFELYDSNGRVTFSSPLRSERTAFPADQYLRQRNDNPDWAVLKLANPVPGAIRPMRIARLSAQELEDLADVYMVGYHANLEVSSRAKLISPNCRPRNNVTSRSEVLFTHTCDTSPGSSGSLLYIETDSGPLAIGVNTAEGEGNGQWNYAQVLPPSVLAMIPGGEVQFAEAVNSSQIENN